MRISQLIKKLHFECLWLVLFATNLFLSVTLHAEPTQLNLSLSQLVKNRSGSTEPVYIETIRLLGADLQSAEMDFDTTGLSLALPGSDWKIIKNSSDPSGAFSSGVYQEFASPQGKRLVIKPTSGAYERCLQDRFEFGLVIVCRVLPTDKITPSSELLAKPKLPEENLPIVAANNNVQQNLSAKSVASTRTQMVVPATGNQPTQTRLLLSSVKFQGEGDKSQLHLQLNREVRYDLAAISSNMYRLVIHDTGLAHQGLILPFFAPQHFRGVNFLKITELPEGLVIDLHMDTGVVPKLVQRNGVLKIEH